MQCMVDAVITQNPASTGCTSLSRLAVQLEVAMSPTSPKDAAHDRVPAFDNTRLPFACIVGSALVFQV